ncbi:MAG: heavy-metal-associated domain-containing protein [Chromatiaceae bacterium]|jgi:hypothetical protein
MSHYVHHVPGRLRIRAKAFQCNPAKARSLERQLRTMEGVLEVRHNERNGSLTIAYDPVSGEDARIMQTLTEAGCLPVGGQGRAAAGSDMAAAFGKALLAAVAQQTVARSFSSLATILR